MSTIIKEASTSQQSPEKGTMLIQLITPGVGSSGVYTADVLEAAARDAVFPAGTLMFADHPSEQERYDRPERSIRDVAGVLLENARWDGTALIAEARTFAPWSTVLTEMKDAIGVSIRAAATLGESDKATGLPVVERITRGISVDFVTAAGRGGAIRQVYESARSGTDLIVRETSANIRDSQLRGLLRDAYGSIAKAYAYMVDYDEAARTIIFELEDPSGTRLLRQGFTIEDDVATALVGSPVEVRRVISYEPVNPPVIPTGTINTESKEDPMPTIEEGRLAELEEAGRRVPVLESELAAALERATASEASVAEANRAADLAEANRIIAEADHAFSPLERRGLLAELPLAESGRLDKDAFTKLVVEAAAEAAEAAGAGRVHGLGASTKKPSEDLSEAELDAELARISGRTVKEA